MWRRPPGLPVIRAPVGEVNVAVRMRDEGAPIGGEGNGGVILSELHLGRDAPVGAALVLQLLLEDGESAVANRVGAAAVRHRQGQARSAERSPRLGVRRACARRFPDAVADTQDGLRLSWPDRWVHVRPSGTEPIVRVIAEAPTDAGGARVWSARSRVPLDALAAA